MSLEPRRGRQSLPKMGGGAQKHVPYHKAELLPGLRGQQPFSIKGHIVNISGFEDESISVATTQFCCYSVKAIVASMSISGQSNVPVKPYLQK